MYFALASVASYDRQWQSVTLQFVACLTDDASSSNYDRNMFIIQATEQTLKVDQSGVLDNFDSFWSNAASNKC